MRKIIFFVIMLFLIAFMAPVMFAQELTLECPADRGKYHKGQNR